MGLVRQILAEAVKQASPHPGAGTWATPWRWSGSAYRSEIGDGMGNSIIAASVLWLARNFPKAPVMLERRRGDALERVFDHPFLSLMGDPSPYYSGVALSWAVMVSFLTDGNGYKMKIRNESKRVVEERFVPHWMLNPHWPSDGSVYIDYYEYTPGSGTYKIRPEDIVHYRYGLDPNNTRKGMSPLKSLLREVYTDEEASRFTASLLQNLGMPGVIISPTSGVVETAEAEAVKAKYQQEFSGDHRGKVMVMTGNTTLETIGFNPQELDLGRLREIPEERVTSVLGVPAAVVGLGTGLQQTKVGATMAELRTMAWEDGIFPLHMILASDMKKQELSEYEEDLDPWVVGFDIAQVPELQESEDERAKRWITLTGGPIATRSEGRAAFDLETLPADDVYLMPFNIVEQPRGQSQEVPDQEEPKAVKASRADARYLRTLQSIQRRAESAMSSDLEAAFDDLGRKAQVAYVAVGSPEVSGRKATPSDITARMMRKLQVETWQTEVMGPIYTRYIDAVGEATFGAVSSRIGVGVAWDIQDPAAQRVIQEGGRRLGLVDIEGQTRDAIFNSLEEGRAAGEGPPSLARRIGDQVPAGPYVNAGASYRALLIARTETLHAQRIATLEAGKEAGFSDYMIFDARLGDTDEECELLDQQIVTFEEAESLVDDEHPNGTRSFSPVPRSQAGRLSGEVKDGAVRCAGCGSKLALKAGPGTEIECRKCKTVYRSGVQSNGNGHLEVRVSDGREEIAEALEVLASRPSTDPDLLKAIEKVAARPVQSSPDPGMLALLESIQESLNKPKRRVVERQEDGSIVVTEA